MTDSIRIFQLAKELNISHTDIVDFLKEKGISVTSHMSPIDGKTQQIVYTEFAKDRQSAERDRKEQVRKEIHDSKVVMETKSVKKFKILSVQDQRDQAKPKKLEAKDVKEDKKISKDAKTKKDVEKKAPKKKLRKITLRESVSSKEKKEIKKDKEAIKKDTSAVKRLKKTLASMDSSPKKKSYKKAKKDTDIDTGDTKRVVELAEYASIDEIAKVLDVSTSEVIGKCLQMGILATVNQRLDWDVIELIAGEYEVELKKHEEVVDDLFVMTHTEEELKDATKRAPVVTIMGHVDHGKTSILDYIRETKVAEGESGGITQRVGAYQVEHNSNKITFLDTPGHEAFTAMRARGAQSTDIVILVVAADDSVMPQTLEAINHAKAAEVPIIVAINKIDLPAADVDKIKKKLSEHNILVEDWGGKYQCQEISAKSGLGIDSLLEKIQLEAEVLDLKANKNTLARGVVVESRLDKGLGAIATILIQKGTMNRGDIFVCGTQSNRVRAMLNERGNRVTQAFPSDPVQILGFTEVPNAGDVLTVYGDEKEAKRIAQERSQIKREAEQRRFRKLTLDQIGKQISTGVVQELDIIIKGDVDGSIEALSDSLMGLSGNEVSVKIIHRSVGMITENDVNLAGTSGAIIIAFNVNASAEAKSRAKTLGVDIRQYSIIYEAISEVKLALEGLLEPEEIEEALGYAEVRDLFKIPKLGLIAGCSIQKGKVIRNALLRVKRGDETLHEGKLTSLKRFKDDVNEVLEGFECGIGVHGFTAFEPGDIIEVYEIKEIKRSLA